MIGRSALLAGAAVAVALVLQISSGFYDPWAVALVSLATAAAVCGALWKSPEGNPAAAQALLGAGSAAGLGFHLFTVPVFSADVRAFQGGFRWFAMASLVVLSAYLCIHLRASLIRARFLLLLACFAVMALVAVGALPEDSVGAWRYGLLAATLGGAWLLARVMPGNAGELAAALMRFQPRTLFILEQGGPEPPALFCFAPAAVRRGRWPARRSSWRSRSSSRGRPGGACRAAATRSPSPFSPGTSPFRSAAGIRERARARRGRGAGAGAAPEAGPVRDLRRRRRRLCRGPARKPAVVRRGLVALLRLSRRGILARSSPAACGARPEAGPKPLPQRRERGRHPRLRALSSVG